MQAYSPALPVGAQHNYRSSFHALSEVVKNEGKLGLVRGVGSAMLRTAMVRFMSRRRMKGAEPAWARIGIVGPAAVVQLCQAGLDHKRVHGREQLLDVSGE